MAVIYQITNMITGHYYIGSAEAYERRKWQHQYELRKGTHKNPHMQAAWKFHGEEAFVFEVLEEVPEGERAFDVENTYLHNCVGRPDCYNVNTDAIGMRTGIPMSEKSKAQLSQNRVGKHAGEAHYRYGQTVSPEVREKIGAAQRGVKKEPRVYTPEGLIRARENMLRNAVRQPQSSLEKVIAKFPAEVQAKYDFSNAVYTGALKRITGCVCPVHGEFDNYAARFRKGWGCAACGAVQRAVSKSAEMKREWADPEKREKMLSARK